MNSPNTGVTSESFMLQFVNAFLIEDTFSSIFTNVIAFLSFIKNKTIF